MVVLVTLRYPNSNNIAAMYTSVLDEALFSHSIKLSCWQEKNGSTLLQTVKYTLPSNLHYSS